MIRTTPFHPRTAAANETGLWSHWSGYLAAEKYQLADKFEYFAIRNAAALIDTSPLYKYLIEGADTERFLAGVLIRDVRKCRVGQAQYTAWCDDAGRLLEDGVVFRLGENRYMLTTAEPNMAYLQDLTGGMRVAIEDVSAATAALAVQGPRSREILAALAPEVAGLGFFHHTPAKIGKTAVTVSRTGYTGDLGYELWVDADDAVGLWDAVEEAGRPYGVIPAGQVALLISRIEAGLILIDVDYHPARYAWNEDQRSTPLEAGLGWLLRRLDSDDRSFIGRKAIEREIATGSTRWRTVGIMVDWRDWDVVHNRRGLIPPKDHHPYHGGLMLYEEGGDRSGYVPSFVYSPLLQRHIGIARVRPAHADPGSRLSMEITIDHRHDLVAVEVTRLPFFDPPRKTS